VIRGENVYPAAIEEAIRSAGCEGEYRVEVLRIGALDELLVDVEGPPELEPAVVTGLKKTLGLRAAVTVVPEGSLPRTEFKSRRIADRRRLGEELRSRQEGR